MKTKFILLSVICVLIGVAHAETMRTDVLQKECDVAVRFEPGEIPHMTIAQLAADTTCMAYIKGFLDESQGEILPATDTGKFKMGEWQDVDAMQLAKVFVKYVNENPARLNKPATGSLMWSAFSAGLYKLSPYKMPVITTGN